MANRRQADSSHRRREELLGEVSRLARRAIFGTAASSFRTCGNQGCRCHHGGPKHGPHVYVSYRDREARKTVGFYVPKAAQEEVLAGIAAWQELRERLRELAELNKQRALGAKRGGTS